MSRYLVILIGLPGAGKSFCANRIINKYHGLIGRVSSVTCSADHYFIRPDGVYDWSAKLLSNAHRWCYREVEKNMNPISYDMAYGDFDLIILDNTNLKKKDRQPYIDLAKKYGYKVKEVIVGEFTEEACEKYFKRCVHKVPLETIKKMARKFEP